MNPAALVEQAKGLANAGRLDDALTLLTPLAGRQDAPWQALSVQADLLKRAGRLEDSAATSRRLVAVRPQSVPARHNLASTLGDLGRAVDAETVCRETIAIGGDAPETWLVLARALQSQSRFAAAEEAYRQALSRRPGYVEVLRDLTQLIWMRDADIAAASAPLDAAIAAAPGDSGLRRIKARLLEYAGDADDAYRTLTTGSLDGPGELAAAQVCLTLDPRRALDHANRAATLAGQGVPAVMVTQAECLLALGRAEEALGPITVLRAREPLNQHVLAHQATAWRMLGDSRYERLYDYDAFVRPYRLETPPGWATLDAYLVDLAAALNGLHTLNTHPVGQSLRGGSQTTASLAQSDDPAIRAFFIAIDAPIRAYMTALGQGDDPLRARNTGRYRIKGSWSVRLRPHGFHADHIHSDGWLSSACHIELPAAVRGQGREGWLRFGASPGLLQLEAQHHVQPQPGTLVLFPSYMWHGTQPFGGEASRLTLAFDVVPD
ncbi:putative 2OG-Fe(II) oxygenase [Brevundimonas sp. SORGH_AS_0993]|uniref:putative 2OG-Fe(II) oxygenase n=1 Tax=Brevundimonas sp. SORGH_AS_0993 TaxID=3041794 RepID=UPI00278710E1|nr:putative 2OG-Fe(II) oxygenase [Brevundimonas sp. SORGH_AS_0993]MDQ1153724.1 tetratricopeptide (TPR) repeat protein [Brevundimonas sp. SORGH_AS_0993]